MTYPNSVMQPSLWEFSFMNQFPQILVTFELNDHRLFCCPKNELAVLGGTAGLEYFPDYRCTQYAVPVRDVSPSALYRSEPSGATADY